MRKMTTFLAGAANVGVVKVARKAVMMVGKFILVLKKVVGVGEVEF